MKIAFLCYSFIPRLGGAQIFSYNIINQFISDGHDVDLFLPNREAKLFKKLYPNSPIKIKSILNYEKKLSPIFPFFFRSKLLSFQKKERYDLWQIVGTYPAGWIGKNLSKYVPVFLRSHGDDIQQDKSLEYGLALNSSIHKKISKTLNEVSHLVAITKTVSDCFIDFEIDQSKITEIPNGVDLNNFNRNVNKNKIKNKLGISKNQIMLLSVGRYHVKKGYEFVADTIKILKERGFNIKWVIVGKSLSVLKNKFKESGVYNDVILLSEIGYSQKKLNFPSDDLIEIYKSADIFIMPSLLETFGMVLLEAMASKLPIISTDAEGCKYVVKDGLNGLTVPVANSMAIATAVQKIINNQELKSKLISNGYKNAQMHDWSVIKEMYLNMYNKILLNKGKN